MARKGDVSIRWGRPENIENFHVGPKPPLPQLKNPPQDVDYDEVPDEDEEEEEEIRKRMPAKRPQPEPKLRDGRVPQMGERSKKGARKTYDEVLANQLVKLQPVTPRYSHHESDPGWCKFKFQTLPSNRGDSGERSSSSSNVTLSSNVGDMYSNLGDIFVGGPFVSQRRHSFTEGDDSIFIHGPGTRDSSVIPVGIPVDTDYKLVGPNSSSLTDLEHRESVSGQEEALYTNPESVVAALNHEVASGNKTVASYCNVSVPGGGGGTPAVKKSPVPAPKLAGVVRTHSPPLEDSEDYMNEDPEGIFHTYHNQKELLEQLQARNNPVPEPALQSSGTVVTPVGEKKISGMFRNIMSKTPFLKKTPSEIHSLTISETERQKTLQPFKLSGSAQAGRDYEAFFKSSAWGGSSTRMQWSAPDAATEQPSFIPENLRRPDVLPSLVEAEVVTEEVGQTRGSMAAFQPAEPAVSGAKISGHAPRVPLQRPLPSHTPLESRPSFPVPPRVPPTPAPRINTPSSSPSSAHHHHAVGMTRSVDHPPPPRHDPSPSPPRLRVAEMKAQLERSGGGNGVSHARARVPPPRPPPYVPQSDDKSRQKVSLVRSMMPYWYQPAITREEAIGLVQQMDSGAFIVRDSQTVAGGYAVTIKVTEVIIRQRKKLADSVKVTEDMCVTHFLIQPDPEGVKLQGWNERAFKSLAEFIAHHTVDKLCLPCKLVLPKSGHGRGERGKGGGLRGGDGAEIHQDRRKPVTMQEALKTGAACDLVYLGSVDVSGPGSAVTLAEAVKQRKLLDISVSVVTFKAAKEGLTVSDNISGLYIKRQYPISSVTYCGADPNDTRWDFPHLQHLGELVPIVNAPCFGVFTRLPDGGGHSCLLFAQYSTSQPVTSVLSYLHQVMRQKQ